jgi:hypothetical protein
VKSRLLLALLATLLTACATSRQYSVSPLAGTWVNNSGITWVINNDGNYHVDIDQDGRRDSWGKLSVRGDEMRIRGTGGLQAGGCKQTGIYRYQLSAATLRFTLVNDRCKARKRHLSAEWRRK